MKMTEIKGLETKELAEKLETAVADYNQMKLNHAVTPMENPSQIKAARRDIARMQTELRQRECNATLTKGELNK
jgi:large subunit ribosomal protein L29